MDEYDAVARRFFNQFLELKLQLDSGQIQKPKDYDRELSQYQRAAEQFKKAAQDMAQRNKELEDELLKQEEEISRVRGQLNEALIALATAKEKLQGLGVIKREARETGYKFTEHMSPESRRVWESLMREIPYRGTHDND